MGRSSSSSGKNCLRGHWRPAEDDKLRQLVESYGPQNWNFIAEHLRGRSGKSCRLRWYNQLDPNINKKPFTEEEEERLLSAHRIYGNKWAFIANFFPGRTDNSVKNHYHVITARRKRHRFAHESCPELGFPKLQPSCHQNIRVSCTSLDYESSALTRGLLGVLGCRGYDRSVFVEPKTLKDGINPGFEVSISGAGETRSKFTEQKEVPFIDFLGVGIAPNN